MMNVNLKVLISINFFKEATEFFVKTKDDFNEIFSKQYFENNSKISYITVRLLKYVFDE